MSLEAQNITVKIGTKTLIEDICLTVEPGELVAVIGPNGAGKSTLLRALVGDMQPASGQIWMGGRPLDQWPRRDRARMRGVLAQQSNLTFAFTVLEVVLMGRGPHIARSENPRDYQIALAALDVCQVGHLAERSYTTLSGGEQQRVQMARVMAQIWEPPKTSTRYLLLDEPTNNLDLAHQHNTLQIARNFTQEGTAVFAILHDLNLAAQYADRIVLMLQGNALYTGIPEDVLTADNIQYAFGMPVTILPHPQMGYPLVIPDNGVLI